MGDVRAVVCTIVARNYLGQAKVLVDSVRRTNPDLHVVTLVVDGTQEDRAITEVGEVALIADLGIAPSVVEPMIIMYSVMELSTALKPALLEALLHRGYEVAIYLDPDIEVYDRLDVAVDAARSGRIALTPHALRPVPRDGREVSERTIMQAGIFNLGFIAVSSAGREFLDWWGERLRTDAVVDFGEALFTDQRWVDWAPALTEVAILRDPGLNVAYWNIHERPLARDRDGRVVVGDERAPLRFFHFSGFDPERPWKLSHFTGDRPRVSVSDSPVLGELCDAHAQALIDAGHPSRRKQPYGFDRVPDGPLLSTHVRSVYRESLLGRLPFPAPPLLAVSDPASLTAWLTEPVACLPYAEMAPADLAIWRGSSDLRRIFPSPLLAESEPYLGWLDRRPERVEAYAELGLPAPARPRVAPSERSADAWWVVPAGEPEPAFATRAVAELVATVLERDGVSTELSQPPSGDPADGGWVHTGRVPGLRAENVVVCLDGERLAEGAIHQALAGILGQKVALWLVGEQGLPPGASFVVPAFDEHWVQDERAGQALRDLGAASVVEVAVPAITAARVAATGRRTVVLAVDGAADLGRQRVEAAVATYRQALGGDDARLVVAVCGPALTPSATEAVRHAIRDRPEIELRTGLDLAGLQDEVRLASAVLVVHDGPMGRLASVLARAAAVPLVSGDGMAAPAGHERPASSVLAAVAELNRRRLAQRRAERFSTRLRWVVVVPGRAVRWVGRRAAGAVGRWRR